MEGIHSFLSLRKSKKLFLSLFKRNNVCGCTKNSKISYSNQRGRNERTQIRLLIIMSIICIRQPTLNLSTTARNSPQLCKCAFN